jgi:hypothetical protein
LSKQHHQDQSKIGNIPILLYEGLIGSAGGDTMLAVLIAGMYPVG